MLDKFSLLNLDVLGFIASLTCAIHCAAIPVIFAISAAGGLTWIADPAIELAFLMSALLIACITLYSGYRKNSISKPTILAFAIGFILLLTGRWMHVDHLHSHGVEFVVTALGGLTIATAHTSNWLSQRRKHMV